MTNGRRGSVLAVTLIVAVVVGSVGVALATRSVRGARTAGWSRDHLAVRLLAESAAEELHAALQRRAGLPGDAVARALLSGAPGTAAAPAPLPEIPLAVLPRDLAAQERALGGSLRIEARAGLASAEPISADPRERRGTVVVDVTARLSRGLRTVATERVRVVRAFKAARVAPPESLDGLGLWVSKATSDDLRRYRGWPVFAVARGGGHKLVDLMTRAGAEGIQAGARGDPRARALAALSSAALERRAQFVVETPAELEQLIASRMAADGCLNGVIHARFSGSARLAFPAFRGRCLISLAGSVEVGDIRLDDARRDALTIVAHERLVIAGSTIEANLLNPTASPQGIVFQQRAAITGLLAAGRFPRSTRLPAREFGDCELGSPAILPAAQAYLLAFAPHPASVTHGREAGAP